MKINRVKIYSGFQPGSSQPKGYISGCNTIRPYWSKTKFDTVTGVKKRRKLN